MSTLLLIVLVAIVAIAVAMAIHAFRRSERAFVESFGLALLPVIFLLTLLLFASHIAQSLSLEPIYLWAAARLAPLVGLFYGYDLYYGIADGPILNTIYGPFAYLLFWPAAIASSPTSVVIIGQAVVILVTVGALGVLFLAEAKRCDLVAWRTVVVGICAFSLLAFAARSSDSLYPGVLAAMAFGVHADAPALALAILACACVYGRSQAPSWPILVLCAGFATLSVWAKQIEVGVVLAIGIYLLLAFGRATCATFFACAVVVGMGVSGVLLAVFGFKETLLNVLVIPGRHPWYGPSVWRYLFAELITQTWVIVVLATILVAMRLRGQRGILRNRTLFVARNPWLLFVLAAVCMLPTSILAAIKVGGASNSYHFAYYLSVLVGLLLTSLSSPQTGVSLGRPAVTRASMVTACLMFCALVLFSLGQLRWLSRSNKLYDNSLEQAFVYAQKNPGTALFPWMPLSSLLAEGKLYHFDYGIFDRQLAGLPPVAGDFPKGIPSNLAYVFYPATMPVPDLFNLQDRPPALQYLPACKFVGDGGPMATYSRNWQAFRCF